MTTVAGTTSPVPASTIRPATVAGQAHVAVNSNNRRNRFMPSFPGYLMQPAAYPICREDALVNDRPTCQPSSGCGIAPALHGPPDVKLPARSWLGDRIFSLRACSWATL